MKNIVLASTSTIYGGKYLEYLQPVIEELFAGVDEIVFIPFARPSGISHDEYTAKAAAFFEKIGIGVKGLHSFPDAVKALQQAKGFFTGGGNTFLLVKQLHEQGLMQELGNQVRAGKPYLGVSAGTNIGGITMGTTNDMPIVYPPSFQTMGLLPFNINPHYLDPIPDLPHMGETREVRIQEFHVFNDIPVIGLREGSWLRVKGDEIVLGGGLSARVFAKGREAYEVKGGMPISR
jgi:Peptidase E